MDYNGLQCNGKHLKTLPRLHASRSRGFFIYKPEGGLI